MNKELSKKKQQHYIIDCDIHHDFPSPDVILPYLSDRWREHHLTYGFKEHHGFVHSFGLYPPVSPFASRQDGWPHNGARPGTDLEFMKAQHLESNNVKYGILNTLFPVQTQLNDEYARALARAVNDWQIKEWLEKDSRLRASIIVPYENPEFAVEEIERVGKHPGFVQIMLLCRSKEPLGRRKYWPIYEAAEAYGLPIGMHIINGGMHGNTSSGWHSYYSEVHTSLSPGAQVQVVSLVCEGVFKRFPKLRVVLIEAGFAWVPSLMWRLDKQYVKLKSELPHLKRLPSEYIREHFRFTTQPMEEPTVPKHFYHILEHLGSDDLLLFATDYPHWDFDDPLKSFPVKIEQELKQKIYYKNAESIYDFKKGEIR
ncbi:hydrolase [Halalkalibacter okhensis]|uniref:Hydrolase n=1 Tax=Halalkalibacter okhensis TaxID=333138 RepID=A0A0B0I692_9BACI|nr:hydrolase [Halalkalibacter okhensis]